jgi:magnesium transporter
VIRAWCYTAGTGRRVDLALDDVARTRSKPGALLWIDVDSPTEPDIEFVRDTLDIHDVTAEDLLKAGQRTKLERIGDHFHLAVHDCSLRDGELLSREVDVVFADGWLLSVRHPGDGGDAPMPLDDAVERFERSRVEHGSNDEGFLLWALLDVIVDRWFEVIDGIDEQLESIEQGIFEDDAGGMPRQLFELRQALVTFRRVAIPLREVVNSLLRRSAPCIGEEAFPHLQDVFDHVLRVQDFVESQREVLTGLLEARLAVMSNQMNQVMKATSSWGAILIVATLIAGIYGMNFQDMPELGWSYGYPGALALMLVVTGALYLVFKRRGWL